MKGINRAGAVLSICVSIAACGADPIGPGGPALVPSFSESATLATPTIGSTIPTTTNACAPAANTGPVLSGASTYVVAYGEIPAENSSLCLPPAEPVSPVPPADSTPLRLSFP